MRGVFKVGPVSRTRISVDRLQETGHDVMRDHAAEERHVDLGADESLGKSLHSEDLVSPCSDPAEKRVAGRGFRGIMSHDEHILTLNVDGESLEEEMECEQEDETVQDAEAVRTVSNPGQPSKKEREEHEATHAQYRSWCVACVRCRGIAMKHHSSIGAGSDEGKLHTFVMFCCFPSQGSQQGTQCWSS